MNNALVFSKSQSSSVAPTHDRLHALDATRGFALMLGVVFHIAWAFMPNNAGVPHTDAASHAGFSYFFLTSHTFRMQLFFLIAGIFARMMYHRRGSLAFAKNRFSRIVLPLILAWLILVPLFILTWCWGSNRSGQNLTSVPLEYMAGLLLSGAGVIPRSFGGIFSLGHLWFLYYLTIFYLLTLVIHPVVARIASASRPFGKRIDVAVSWSVQSQWAVLVLVPVIGFSLWPMRGWYGVDTPARSPLPALTVVFAYGLFYGYGWLLHRQIELLHEFGRRWRWKLAIGLALSVPLYFAMEKSTDAGVSNQYPLLSPNQISDWEQFINQLNTSSPDSSKLAHLMVRLSSSDRSRIARMSLPLNIDLKIGVCKSINHLMSNPNMLKPSPNELVAKKKTRRLLDPYKAKESRQKNRAELERLLPGVVIGDPTKQSGYWTAKLGYSMLYGSVCYCLVCSILGLFQHCCPEENSTWRYIADSSYWIYLAHLPTVIWLQILIADYEIPALIKFAFLNALSFLLLFLSYHFLVRSTLVGRILNGRRHPFTWPSFRGTHTSGELN